MDGKKILSIVLILVGLFYAIVPHNTHVSSGLGFGADHTVHIALGVILLIVGVVVLWKGKKSSKPAKK